MIDPDDDRGNRITGTIRKGTNPMTTFNENGDDYATCVLAIQHEAEIYLESAARLFDWAASQGRTITDDDFTLLECDAEARTLPEYDCHCSILMTHLLIQDLNGWGRRI